MAEPISLFASTLPREQGVLFTATEPVVVTEISLTNRSSGEETVNLWLSRNGKLVLLTPSNLTMEAEECAVRRGNIVLQKGDQLLGVTTTDDMVSAIISGEREG